MRKAIQVVTFNSNEARAVDLLMNDLPSPWVHDFVTHSMRRSAGPDEWHLEHVPLMGQGNVVAAARLGDFFCDRQPQDYIVFYGCAGALRAKDVGKAYLVQYANYFSLGTVESEGNGLEKVTLKNKWLCHLQPEAENKPLRVIDFPLCIPGRAPIDLCGATGLPGARVASTDKVVRITPSPAPTPIVAGPPHEEFAPAEWSYGTALGLMERLPETVVVEMESYGIGRMAQALKIQDRVAVLRITTDALQDHASTDNLQRDLLAESYPILGRILALLWDPTRSWT